MMDGRVVYAVDRFGDDQPSPAAPSDRERFEQMLARHHRRLRRVVCGIITDPNRVDDVLQEGYLKAYRKLPRSFANEAHEGVWLYRVVYRCCVDDLRRTERHRETPVVELHSVMPHRDERSLHVLPALRELRAQDRAVLMLVGLAGFGYDEAAEVLQVPRGTVASRLSAARARLREVIDA